MSALGQKQTFAAQKAMSALPPKADIRLAVTEQVHSVTYCGSLSPQGDKGAL